MSDNTPQKNSKHSSEAGQTGSRLSSIPGSIQEEDEDNVETPTGPRQSDISVSRKDYGTLEEGTVRQRPTPQRASSPPGFAQNSPQTLRNQRRPAGPRRPSTRRTVPHRGELFSVDDDPDELEGDQAETFPTLKRIPSTVKRKATVLPLLPRLESEDPENEVAKPDVETPELPVQHVDVFDEDEDDEFEAEDDDTLSDAESFTLKDRQLAINETHPFGIKIWKPALYKKNRSVEKNAEEDIHSSPSQIVSKWLWVVNGLWTIVFGWWMAVIAALAAAVCFLFSFEPSAKEYARVLFGLSGYLFWPFGKFVKLEQDEQYAEEDEGEGRSITDYERWQRGDLEYGRLMFGPSPAFMGSIVGRRRNSVDSSEREHLLGRNGSIEQQSDTATKTKRRLFGRGQWTLGRIVYFGIFYIVIAPVTLLVSLICWFFVFTIPMGRVLVILLNHLRKRPLALSFHRDNSYTRDSTKPSSVLLCTYRAAGLRYWKYTVDGTNIFLINFLSVVIFVIIDYYLLREALGIKIWLTNPALVFILSLVSIIPLAYFIGQAVASISAQSSMGMGAAVNAFFSTIVEIYLYCVALNEGKGALVEGSVIGSIFAGLLLMPGLSMCFGAIKRKTQRFNVKSSSATTTMLLFAIIATFGPTLFYKIYGSHELICMSCSDAHSNERDCRRCYFSQVPSVTDDFFVKAVRPFCWVAAICLFLSYIIGLFFTLRTHAAVIWTTEIDEKKAAASGTAATTTDVSPLDTRLPSVVASQQLPMSGHHVHRASVRESQLYNRILGQSLRSAGMSSEEHEDSELPHIVPPKTPIKDSQPVIPGLSEEENSNFVHQVAEMAATAATLAARDVVQHPKATSYQLSHSKQRRTSVLRVQPNTTTADVLAVVNEPTAGHGGHDAPNWSRKKSSIILLVATVAYAVIAEALVDTVDTVLAAVTINEKFLGITLFALVPNTTEFLNAISFAMNGNIALSMEIGSAYVLQVCLIQIPCLVLYTALIGRWTSVDPLTHSFNMIFPQWDMATVILCVFLLSHVYSEGKSNYFKGSILVLTYLVVLLGFWFSGYTSISIMGASPSDTLALGSGWIDRVVSKSEL